MDEDQVRAIVQEELAKFAGQILSAGITGLDNLGVLEDTLFGNIFAGFSDLSGTD